MVSNYSSGFKYVRTYPAWNAWLSGNYDVVPFLYEGAQIIALNH